MGGFMAAALSRLLKENEGVVTAAHAVAELLVDSESFCEQVMDVGDDNGMRGVSFQWRAEFRALQDLKDFDAAVSALMSAVLEQ